MAADIVQPNKEYLVRLHLAEYQALTARWNQLLTIMFTVWTVAFAYLGFTFHIWNNKNPNAPLVLWSTLLIEQTIALAWLHLLFEQYGIVLYQETDLRQSITTLVEDTCFWDYEIFLITRRRRRNFLLRLWEWLGPTISVGALVVVVWYRVRHQWSRWDLMALCVGILLSVLTLFLAHGVMKTRRDWTSALDRIDREKRKAIAPR